MKRSVIIFAIETSCDETSVAIINDKKKILSQITVNQKDHSKFGGVVPEIASRAHLQILQKIIPDSFKKAKININDIDLFCATCGPGLIGGLLVGSTIAKSMAAGLNKPFYPINHLEGHLLSTNFNSKLEFPNIAFLLTGGHTQIYLIESVGKYQLLGESIDDAIGETFDKVGKLLGLGYPGGAALEKLATKGDEKFFNLPHPLEKEKGFNFSFSGIKTAVNILVKKNGKVDAKIKKNMAASFQKKIVEILNKKLIFTLDYLKEKNIRMNNISVVGGVAANKKIKESLNVICRKNNLKLIHPPLNLCGDNAIMIANVCLEHFKINKKPELNFKSDPRLQINAKKII